MTMALRSIVIARLQLQLVRSSRIRPDPVLRLLSSSSKNPSGSIVEVSRSMGNAAKIAATQPLATTEEDKVKLSACGDDDAEEDDDEIEEEEMFVEPHASFGHDKLEWGGPRRGGRLPEPTRFGDWERKGRCTDF